MATKLGLYNGALFLVGERKLASLTENVESRRMLDDVYDKLRLLALEAGFWKFALRTSRLSYSASVNTDEFGYRRAYEKPEDFLRLHKLCQDELLQIPLNDFSEEGSFWFGHSDEIYISYVSQAADYGLDLSRWTPTFANYFEHLLAHKIVNRLAPPADVGKQGNNNLERQLKAALSDALAKDAVSGPTQFAPNGTWTSSRSGSIGSGGRRDRGNRGQLIG